MRAWPLLLVALAGCVSGPVAPTPAVEDVASALTRVARLHYEQRLARERPDDVLAQPSQGELQAARHTLQAALRRAGARPSPSGSVELHDAVAAARSLLLGGGFVFLPTQDAARDPGVALARVVARETGLSKQLWGTTVRYRRILHDGVLLPDYPSYRAIRLGLGQLPPAGRHAGPTVFLDQQAIARRAGRPPYASLSAAELADTVELAQVALMLVSRDVRREELLVRSDRERELTRLHARHLTTLLRYGPPAVILAVIREQAASAGPVERIAGAEAVLSGLGSAPEGLSEAELRERAGALWDELRRGP